MTFRFSPLATLRDSILGQETGALGTVIYTRKDSAIDTIPDIRGKRVGVGQVLSLGTFGLGFQVSRRHTYDDSMSRQLRKDNSALF